jgi:hypothetical protein
MDSKAVKNWLIGIQKKSRKLVWTGFSGSTKTDHLELKKQILANFENSKIRRKKTKQNMLKGARESDLVVSSGGRPRCDLGAHDGGW